MNCVAWGPANFLGPTIVPGQLYGLKIHGLCESEGRRDPGDSLGSLQLMFLGMPACELKDGSLGPAEQPAASLSPWGGPATTDGAAPCSLLLRPMLNLPLAPKCHPLRNPEEPCLHSADMGESPDDIYPPGQSHPQL